MENNEVALKSIGTIQYQDFIKTHLKLCHWVWVPVSERRGKMRFIGGAAVWIPNMSCLKMYNYEI